LVSELIGHHLFVLIDSDYSLVH